VLCPHRDTEHDFYEQPKVTHKKKTDRDREKERLEKELIDKAKEEYRLRQQDKGRPLLPREPLKRTADNNWVHVYCALWHPEIKFKNATRFDTVEGIGASTLRYDAVCKLCKTARGACASCLQCHATFHVGCAHGNSYVFGFDMTPVKVSRRDAVPTVTLNGDTGSMAAAIWCKEHAPKTLAHPMNEQVEGTDMIALQLFAREFKQADLTLTGTARKANLVDQTTRIAPQVAPPQTNRRASAITTQTPTSARGRQSNAGLPVKEESSEPPASKPERKCARCKVEASPRWWEVNDLAQPIQSVVDGPLPTNGTESKIHISNGQNSTGGNGPIANASGDQKMTDAPTVASVTPPERLRLDTNVEITRSPSYLCQKCHWKKQNGIVEEEASAKPLSALPEAQQLPLRSPPIQPFVPPPPPAMAGSWNVPNGPPHPTLSTQPPPLPAWHNGPPPGPGHLPHHLHNGIGHPPPPHGPPLNHPPPFHAPYPPPNGYPPYSGPPVHPQIPPALSRSPYPPPPANGVPPPLHLNNGAMLLNGMHSPHAIPYSPTHPHGHPSSRSTESPYTAPPPAMPQYPPVHHGSPAPGRPATPRDTVMRDAPVVTSAPTERANTGASASPSLRNLLH
jgi:hypothetical protein